MNYLDTETLLPHPKINVITKISKWDNYSIVEDNGIKYIVGTSLTDKNLFDYDTISSPLFLYELLRLYVEIPQSYLSIRQEETNVLCTCDIKDSVNKKIISFCKKYGLPFWSDGFTIDFFNNINPSEEQSHRPIRSVLFHEIVPFATDNHFPIASFCYALKELHHLFLIIAFESEWVFYDDKKQKWIFDDVNIKDFFCIQDENILNIFHNKISQKHDINTSLCQSLSVYKTYWNDDLSRLQLECDNLFHLAIYYLSLMRQSKTFSGGYIRTCKKCNQLFVASNPRMKYCGNPCTRQAYYSKSKGSDTK